MSETTDTTSQNYSEKSESQSQTILTLAVNSDHLKQLRICFRQEKDEIQAFIKKLAKKNERDYIVEYANWQFLSSLDKQYSTERVKYVASQASTLELLIKTGDTREEALLRLDITEEEMQLAIAPPRKGVAKKLADLQRIYGA